MITREAIEKAIDGGWELSPYLMGYVATLKTKSEIVHTLSVWCSATIALDPSFWIALGKASKWRKSYCTYCRQFAGFEHDDGERRCLKCNAKAADYFQTGWEYYAHTFFSLTLTGGDTEKFWADLLTK